MRACWRARFSHAQVIARRGDQVNFNWSWDVRRNGHARQRGAGGMQDFGISENAPDLPDMSSRDVGCRQPPATVHGVVFDIFGNAPLRKGVLQCPQAVGLVKT